MVTTIRVDDDVYRELERRASGFGDTPNLVLRRLLGLERPAVRVAEAALEYRPRLTGFRRGRPPLTERRTTSQAAMRLPILKAVQDAGGEASTAGVLDAVGRELERSFLPADYDLLSNGQARWRVTASFERKNLVEEGLLDGSSPRGVWRLTAAGRDWLAGRDQTGQPEGWDLEGAVKAVERLMSENRGWLQEMASR